MSGGPDLELQGAIAQRLKVDVTLTALTGINARIFQDVPPPPLTFPYITIGESQDLPDQAECIDGSEIFVTFHIYSKSPGYEQAKRIERAIYVSLHDQEDELALAEHRVVLLKRVNALSRFAEDTVIKHVISTYRALTEPLDL